MPLQREVVCEDTKHGKQTNYVIQRRSDKAKPGLLSRRNACATWLRSVGLRKVGTKTLIFMWSV